MRLLESRWQVSLLGSLFLGGWLVFLFPFPGERWLFQLVREDKPWVFYLLAGTHHLLLFSTPFFVLLGGLSLLYIFVPRGERAVGKVILPPWPALGELAVVVGEVHQ